MLVGIKQFQSPVQVFQADAAAVRISLVVGGQVIFYSEQNPFGITAGRDVDVIPTPDIFKRIFHQWQKKQRINLRIVQALVKIYVQHQLLADPYLLQQDIILEVIQFLSDRHPMLPVIQLITQQL